MGKKNSHTNYPANASLSYTLPHLQSHVRLEDYGGQEDVWEPLLEPYLVHPRISLAAKIRFLKHLSFIKQQFNYKGAFKVQSANNFPHGTGLASSASSFAALTQCATHACAELTQTSAPSIRTQSEWSRHGSGSSCRSFFSPWALWETETAEPIELPFYDLHHQVILINADEKKVSSSEAHQRIQTSSNYPQRPARANNHLKALLNALQQEQWEDAYHICWQEFQDMHALFHTSEPAFAYITAEARQALQLIQDQWKTMGDGPIVTMDAGPNIHLLYRSDQANLAKQLKKKLMSQYHVF
jgi:diphosphomevalonate decarboxylase